VTHDPPSPDTLASKARQAFTACAKCGACTAVCPVYRITGRESLTARGRLHLLGKMTGNEPAPELAEIFSKCLLCGACRKTCPRGIDVPSLIMEARAALPRITGFSSFKKFLAQQALARPGLLAALTKAARPLGLLPKLPAESGLNLTLTSPLADLASPELSARLLASEPASPSSSIALYFTGCLTQYLAPAIGLASEALLAKLCNTRLLVPDHQSCCGLAAKAAGDPEQARELARRTIALFSGEEVRELPVFTSCASCYAGLKGYPALLAGDPDWRERAEAFSERVWEFSTFILHHRRKPGEGFRQDFAPRTVVYHDPCHLRFAGITAPPRELIRQAPDLKLLELPHGPQCCGQGGLFHLAYPALSQSISQHLVADLLTTDAELVVTSCSGCLMQWQQGLTAAGAKAHATHLAILLAQQLDRA
jgi:glycolate oxidase iron-sulfur subunit